MWKEEPVDEALFTHSQVLSTAQDSVLRSLAGHQTQTLTPIEQNPTPPQSSEANGKGKSWRKKGIAQAHQLAPRRTKVPDWLPGYIVDFSREFHDEAATPSNITRAAHLFERAGVDSDTFIEQMYEARRITKGRANIQKWTEQGKNPAWIVADKGRGYKGYCQFSTYAESAHDLHQWMPGSANPERVTIMYGGTVAMQIICEERGWNYDHWRGSDVGDLATIYLWSVEIVGEEEAKQHSLQRVCRRQALDILEVYWGAVEALAAVLGTRGKVRGREAHQIIQQAIDPTYSDWRMETEGREQWAGFLG